MRRVLRVLPAYFLFLCVYWILTTQTSLSTNSFLSGEQVIPFWFYFTLLQNNYMAVIGHMGNPSLSMTWSLAVEEQFYIVLPIVAVLVRPSRLAYALAMGAVAAIVFRSLHADWGLPLCSTAMSARLDCYRRFSCLPGSGRCCSFNPSE